MFSKHVMAVETSAVDIIYPETHSELRDKFIALFKEDAKGGLCLKDPEEFQAIVLKFANGNGVQFTGETDAEKTKSTLELVLGKPEIKAGGALANTFHLMVNCKVSGEAIYKDAKFYCTIGDDEISNVFVDSLKGNIFYSRPEGSKTTVIHIIPVNGERFMIPLISFTKTCDIKFERTIAEIDRQDFSKIGMLMIGGYFWYSRKYAELTEIIAKKLEAIQNKDERPTVVLTVASYLIAGSTEVKAALERLKDLAKVIVFANAGEFRVFMGMDSEWQSSLPKDSKPADAIYKRLENIATEKSLSASHQRYSQNSNVTFVVTNGEHGVRVVSNQGITDVFTPPETKNIVNTVGAGDVFAGGYLLGESLVLPIAKKLRLGFTAAKVVICQNDARLPVQEGDNFTGLPAYLDTTKTSDRELINDLTQQKQKLVLGIS